MPDNFLRAAKEGAPVKLRVSPGAKGNAVKGLYGEDAIRLTVAAPPVDGKANAQVEGFLSGLLGVPKGDVSVVGGTSGRDKIVLVRGVEPREIRTRLDVLL